MFRMRHSCVGLLFAVAGCTNLAALSPIVQPSLQVAAPVERVRLPQIKVVAIGMIEGRGGEELREDLSQALVESGRFRVVDRAKTDQILKEHRLRSSGLLRSDETRRLGQFLGADAYIMGSVTAHGTERFTSRLGTQETRAVVELHTEIVDLRTAEVVASRRVRRTISSEADVGGQIADRVASRLRGEQLRRTEADAGGLLARARSRVVSDFARALTQ